MSSDWDTATPSEPEGDGAGLPPHSIEAERGILGCILLDQTCLSACVQRFKAGSQVFYDPKHRRIYEAMVALSEDAIAIDIISLRQELADALVLQSCGGLGYISSLEDATPSAVNLEHYLTIVVQKYALRTIIVSCSTLTSKAQEGGSVASALADTETLIANAVAQLTDSSTTRHVADLMPAAIERIESLHASQGAIQGVPTGFHDLDILTRGLKPGQVFVLAGRPSAGKSAYSMNIADHVAVTLGMPAGVLSLEMTADSLMLRLLCARAKVSASRVMNGTCSQDAFTKLAQARIDIDKAPLYIDDESGITDLQLKAKARRMKQAYGIQLLVIDYLQLIHSARKTGNRQEEVASVARGVRALAKELQVPIVLLAQLNRDVEKAGRKPRLSDLRESGEIEAMADLVGMLYAPNESPSDNINDPAIFAIPVNLLLAKHRNGPTGEIQLVFFKPYTKFESSVK